MFSEPKITINGTSLDNAQALTMRVALESFFMHLTTEGLGDDEIGKGLCQGYLGRIKEIREIMGH